MKKEEDSSKATYFEKEPLTQSISESIQTKDASKDFKSVSVAENNEDLAAANGAVSDAASEAAAMMNDESFVVNAANATSSDTGPVIKPLKERVAVVIPCFNHGTLIEPVIEKVLSYGLKCIVVDDGSAQGSLSALKDVASRYPEIIVLYHLYNSGKGGAILTGLRVAEDLGFTHILQVDADGQHNLDDIPKFLAISAKYPKAVISGNPIFSEEAPKGRVYGRRITNFWVMVETLGTQLKESMCGFRIYPIKSLMSLYNRDVLPRHMDFDIAALVRLYWDGIDVLFVNTKVRYLINGHSNFRMLHDNLKISWMHTKLVFNTVLHLPQRILDILRRKDEYPTIGKRMETYVKEVNDATVDHNGNLVFKEVHAPLKDGDFHEPSSSKYTDESHHSSDGHEAWHEAKEQKVALNGIKTVVFLQSILGRKFSSLLVYPIIGFYWSFDSKRRAYSDSFLKTVAQKRAEIVALEHQGKQHLISSQWSLEPLSSYRHFVHFGNSILDKLNAWRDEFKLGEDVVFAPESQELLKSCFNRGCMILTSHLGNIDTARALVSVPQSDGTMQTLNALVYEDNAIGFASVMKDLAPRSRFNLVPIANVGPDTAIMLKDKLDRNEWIAISADRISVNHMKNGSSRIRHMNFMGKDAPFAEGPFILATLMEVDIIQIFAIKDNDKVFLHGFKLAEGKKVARAERDMHIQQIMEAYVRNLERLCLCYPLEWFNYYDFWNADKAVPKK